MWGVAPLKIETGRYEGILTENRLIFNNISHINNCIEDEKHVLLYCPVYEDLPQYLFNHAFIIIILCICLMLINLYFYLIIRICFFILPKSAMRF